MKFKFIKYTYLWFFLSGLMMVVGIAGMIYNQNKYGTPLEYGIDFTGGSVMEFKFEAETDRNALFDAIEAVDPKTVSQITLTDEGTYVVQSKDISEDQLKAIEASVLDKLGKNELLRFNSIGPKIGDSLKKKAFAALGIACVAIVLYISYAFRKVPKRVSPWRFGICAIVALIHDIVTVVGVFAIMGYEVNSLFITALLTVLGFSVHDTIVVFDRIRENLQKQTRNDTFGDIADISLNQTMGRSLNTSLATLFPLVALYFWGAPSIRVFIFALIVGITVGTYSSIFIASPLLTLWQERMRDR